MVVIEKEKHYQTFAADAALIVAAAASLAAAEVAAAASYRRSLRPRCPYRPSRPCWNLVLEYFG